MLHRPAASSHGIREILTYPAISWNLPSLFCACIFVPFIFDINGPFYLVGFLCISVIATIAIFGFASMFFRVLLKNITNKMVSPSIYLPHRNEYNIWFPTLISSRYRQWLRYMLLDDMFYIRRHFHHKLSPLFV